MFHRSHCVLLLASALIPLSWCAERSACEPAREIRLELAKAARLPIADPVDFDPNVAAFKELRERYSDNLFVHERYQDAVHQHGIEGHLQALTEEYQAL